MIYGDYYGEVAKGRIEETLRSADHDHLVKEARLATKDLRTSMVARAAALVIALFG